MKYTIDLLIVLVVAITFTLTKLLDRKLIQKITKKIKIGRMRLKELFISIIFIHS